MKKLIPRDYLLVDKQKATYIPQVDDKVYYFFQGHEKFIHTFNCFFYSGASKELSF